jgi:NADH-quinone oxidoreductase subunit H
VGGTFTEFSGRLLAFFRLALDCELVVVSALIAAVFLPFFIGNLAILNFLLFLAKVTVIVFLLTLMRTVMARFRLDQMIDFCWKILAPLSLLQIFINIIMKGLIK